MRKIIFLFGILAGLTATGNAFFRSKASSYSNHGAQLYKDGKYAEAAQAFESALANDATRTQRRFIYLYMGKSYESYGRLDKAIAAYEQAVDYDHGNWRRHRDLGGLYEQAELYGKAIESYKTAEKLAPREPSLFIALGRTWRKIGLYSYSLTWLQKAVASGEYPLESQQELSLLYEGQGRFEDAATASAAAGDDPKRLIFLAALAGDAKLTKEGLRRMKEMGLSRDTIQTYENLVQLTELPPKDILSGKISGVSLQELLQKP